MNLLGDTGLVSGILYQNQFELGVEVVDAWYSM